MTRFCRRACAGAIGMMLLACALVPRSLAASSPRIRLDVLEPRARKAVIHRYPVSVGLVFPKGELPAPPGGRLVDGQGQTVPFEAEATA